MGVVLRAFLVNLAVFAIGGSLAGWSISLDPDSNYTLPWLAGFVLVTLFWISPVFLSLLFMHLRTLTALVLVTANAIAAGLLGYFFYRGFVVGEVQNYVLAGWGKDVSTYTEFPIRGFELLGIMFFVISFVCGLSFLSLRFIKLK